MKPPRKEATRHAGPSGLGNEGQSPGGRGPDHEEESIKCPVCGYGFITRSNGKKKLRTRILVFAKNGDAMGICPKCKTNLKVPVALREQP